MSVTEEEGEWKIPGEKYSLHMRDGVPETV